MSWTQGIMERKDMPESWVKVLDSYSDKGKLEAISWYVETADEFDVHYYKDGHLVEIKSFKVNPKEDKQNGR